MSNKFERRLRMMSILDGATAEDFDDLIAAFQAELSSRSTSA
ncbi:hypothetical protein [Actinoplanes hulinensis]|nr:hypothetical protein [Actinoplanes hulinensis]